MLLLLLGDETKVARKPGKTQKGHQNARRESSWSSVLREDENVPHIKKLTVCSLISANLLAQRDVNS